MQNWVKVFKLKVSINYSNNFFKLVIPIIFSLTLSIYLSYLDRQTAVTNCIAISS